LLERGIAVAGHFLPQRTDIVGAGGMSQTCQ
jgi:hypothetical protein